MPQQHDLTIRRGNNVPIAWRGRSESTSGPIFPLAGSEFVLTIVTRGPTPTTIRKDSAVDAGLVVDLSANTVTWKPTLDETRLIPMGRLAAYELERRIGEDQRTWATGQITGVGGLGDD